MENTDRWSFQTYVDWLKEATPVPLEIQRTGVTGSMHELGEGHPYFIAQCYSNKTFRQFVLVDQNWWDCLGLVTDTQAEILERRIVAPEKVAHVASSYGITLLNADGSTVKFTEVRPEKPAFNKGEKSMAKSTGKNKKNPAEPKAAPQASAPEASTEAVKATVKRTFTHAIVGAEYNLASFEEELARNFPEQGEVIYKFFGPFHDWKIQIGESDKAAALYPYLQDGREQLWPVYAETSGKFHLPWGSIAKRAPFTNESKLAMLFSKMPKISESPAGRPSFSVEKLSDPVFLAQLIEGCEYFKSEVQAYLISKAEAKAAAKVLAEANATISKVEAEDSAEKAQGAAA